ncbi:HAD hydrolase family protein [Demequina mangrovi]|uniref:Cof subfamily of IIB subfamily of haloacid dehalogenase superfamily/HAD-superfamily hydrolase, subfamily IIB n=1 Tax=Demequina mangrovi TaxID=1043493 RepID=A0A1H6V9V6_9MICO|nr:HAD family hydrolase [Demequina mangrovi]SEI98547.1 hypothetical protein SAMN05421637_0646 [Demequina mangrovi]
MTSPAPASSRRAVFLDVDGTYAHHGKVPDAHVDAVRAARRAGHVVLLCTGRPASLLPDAITSAGFDGYVAGAGAYAELDGEVLLDTRFPAHLAARARAALEAHGALYFLEAPDATYAYPSAIETMQTYLPRRSVHSRAEEEGRKAVTSALRPTEDLSDVVFGKITTFHAETPLPEIAAEIGPEVSVIPSSIPDLGPGAGEMFLTGVHKASGIVAVIERLGLAPEHVVAFGDGPNDFEMLELAGTAVAIEGSSPALLALADHVAAPPEQAGLAAAFAELGLLG